MTKQDARHGVYASIALIFGIRALGIRHSFGDSGFDIIHVTIHQTF